MADHQKILNSLCDCITLVQDEKFVKKINNLGKTIVEIKTQEGNNSKAYLVFHQICLNNSKDDILVRFTNLAIEKVQNNQINFNCSQELSVEMINYKNDENGKTPLFLAITMNKNVFFMQHLARCLIEHGADASIKDNKGQTLMHLCALYNNLQFLAYLYEVVKLDINIRDQDGKTPLHVAAFEGKTECCTFLIAKTKYLETKDKDGFTPLHLSVFSCNYRIIRHLILRGASRKILSPQYTAEEIGKIMNVPEDVLDLLKQPACLSNFNPVRPPIVEARASCKTFVLNILLLLMRYGIIVVFIYNYCMEIMIYVSLSIGLVEILSLIAVSLKNPGYQKHGGDISQLYRYNKEENVCPYCEIKKDNGMKHCQQCNLCVNKFDHHCPWIHNCVGAG